MHSIYSVMECIKSYLYESPIHGNDPVSKASGETAPGLINILPEDLVLEIFKLVNAETVASALSSINVQWKKTADGFYKEKFSSAFAALAFGKVDLTTHFGIDIGPDVVPRLSLKEYKDVEEGRCLLTYFPKEIPVEDENGVVSLVPPRAKYIGELVKKPTFGNATSFDPNSWKKAINEEREIKGGEWVITYKKPIGHGTCFADQLVEAKKQGEGIDIAEFEKTVYAVFMHYVKTGEPCFTIDQGRIRFKEKTFDWRVACCFGPSGLSVSNSGYDDGYGDVAVALARKSIGTRTLGT